MSELGHVHDYRNKRFIDRCHYVDIEKTCRECGAVHIDRSPRDFALNPLQITFAREDCPRCVEMVTTAGLVPASWRAHV